MTVSIFTKYDAASDSINRRWKKPNQFRLDQRIQSHQKWLASNMVSRRGWLGLYEYDLSNRNLRNANLSHAVFERVDLRNADFTGTIVALTLFSECDLTGAIGIKPQDVGGDGADFINCLLPRNIAESIEIDKFNCKQYGTWWDQNERLWRPRTAIASDGHRYWIEHLKPTIILAIVTYLFF